MAKQITVRLTDIDHYYLKQIQQEVENHPILPRKITYSEIIRHTIEFYYERLMQQKNR